MTTRSCSACFQRKPVEEFHRNRRSSDGYGSQSKECQREATRRWRAANREELRARRPKPKTIRTCPECGTEFEASHPLYRFCQRRCAKRAENRKRRARQ